MQHTNNATNQPTNQKTKEEQTLKLILFLPILIAIIVIAALGVAGYMVWRKLRYKTVRADEAMLITGANIGKEGDPGVVTDNGRSVKVIQGGGHMLRRFQEHQIIQLTSFQLSLNVPRVLAGGIPIQATATAQITVASDPASIVTYAEQFSGKVKKGDTSIVESELSEILEGNLRTVLSSMTVEEILSDREKFNTDVVKVAEDQLMSMGFKLTSLVLKDVDDADKDNPYIENLGRALSAKVRKDAEMAEADNQRESRIHVANQNKLAEEEEVRNQAELAEVKRETELKQQENKRQVELAKVKAEKDKDLEAIRLEKQVQDERLKLEANKKEEQLRITQLEKERQVDIEKKDAEVRKAKADANYYETTRNAEAEAEKSRIDGETKAKIQEAQGRAKAASDEAQGLAEAKVTLEKGKAEAEALSLKAEAISKNGEALITERIIDMLPKYAKEIAAPLNNIESVKITNMGGNGSSTNEGVSAFARDITSTMTQLQEPLKDMTGIDIAQMLKDVTQRGIAKTIVVETPSEVQVKEGFNAKVVDTITTEMEQATPKQVETVETPKADTVAKDEPKE